MAESKKSTCIPSINYTQQISFLDINYCVVLRKVIPLQYFNSIVTVKLSKYIKQILNLYKKYTIHIFNKSYYKE